MHNIRVLGFNDFIDFVNATSGDIYQMYYSLFIYTQIHIYILVRVNTTYNWYISWNVVFTNPDFTREEFGGVKNQPKKILISLDWFYM